MAEQKFFFLDMTKAGVPDGGSIKTDTLKWMELDSWNFHMHQSADANVKSGSVTTTSASGSFSFSIKYNGPFLFRQVVNSVLQTQPVTFRAYRGGQTTTGTSGTPIVKYFELVFTNLVVAGRHLSGDEGQKMESIELAFEQVSISYWQMQKSGPPALVATKTYNSKTNVAG
jgi:type VI protein secretion system component Hcp